MVMWIRPNPTQPNKIFIICVPRLTPANRRRYFYLFLKITWKGKRNNKITNFHTWMLVVLEVTFSNWKSQIRYGTVVPGQLWHKLYYFLIFVEFFRKKNTECRKLRNTVQQPLLPIQAQFLSMFPLSTTVPKCNIEALLICVC